MEVKHHHFDSIDSTQDWAKKNLSSLDLTKLNIITADEQSKGRGRFNRHWHSPKDGGLYATFCFSEKKASSAQISPLSLIIGLTFAEVLQKLGLQILLKWPNDIYANGKKMGGILIEVQKVNDEHIFIIGVGININMDATQLNQVDCPATSIQAETEKTLTTESILSPLESIFKRNVELFFKQGFAPFQKDFEQISILSNKIVTIDDSQNIIKGKYVRVDVDGALILEVDGVEKRFVSAEIKGWE